MKSIRKYVVPICILVLIDQAVKLVIKQYAMDADVDVIGSLVRFSPLINRNLSWGGNFIKIFSSFWFLTIMNLAAYPLIISLFLFYEKKFQATSLGLKLALVSGLAGITCSLIDKIFWGGSLDFVQLPHLFTFDIKDCYLTLFEALLIIGAFIHNKEISTKEYLNFCFHKKA